MSFFAKNLRYLRSLKKINQTDFANIFGLTRSAIGAYEEQRSEPKLDIIIEMANYFNITIDDFLKTNLSQTNVNAYFLTQKNNELKNDLQKIISELQNLEKNL